MTDAKLDRLSALLEGLAPVVTFPAFAQAHEQVGSSAVDSPGLQLYCVPSGATELEINGSRLLVESPSLVAFRAGQSCVFHPSKTNQLNRLIEVHVRLTGPVAKLFLEEFEQPRTIQLVDDEPALHLAVTMIESELHAPRCGHPALLNRAGDIMFIGLLRHLVAHPGAHGAGLFNGLADPRIARALVAMHQNPALRWDLDRLAQTAGMSRTAFATKFHDTMRRPPGKYLSAIRLALARRSVDMGKGLKEAARVAGYTNTSALSRALAKAKLQCS